MKVAIAILFFLSIQLPASAFSWWSPKARGHLNTLRTSYKDPFASTMLGVCKVDKIKYKEIDKAVIEKQRVRVETMNSGRINSVFVLQNIDKRPVPAKLMIVLPGAFTTTQSAQPVRMAQRFFKRGYHVVTIPNPWGLEFLKERPYFTMGSFVKEGEAIYMAMRSAVSKLRSRGLLLDEISVMGISGGGYLTAMVAGLDSISGRPILSGHATSIAAPMIWSQTMKHLDGYMQEVREGLNTRLIKLLPSYWKICRSDSQAELDVDLLKKAKLLTIHSGFHSHMIKSIQLFDELNSLNSIPNKGFKKWRKNMNFARFYDRYNPEGKILLNSKWGRIDSWVNLAKDNGYNKLRILTSIDDFLNVPEVFEELNIEEERLLLIPFGGHWGIRGFGAWFDKLFELSFGSKVKLVD
jgi:hypothetical protein